MPEKLSSVCNAVMNEVMSLGDTVDACESAKSACSGAAEDGARARLSVCRNDAKLLLLGGDIEAGIEGEGGRLGVLGDGGVPLRNAIAVDGGTLPLGNFFFGPKERRKDHSDSNWIDSSPERGEKSSSAASSRPSILLSANLIIKTKNAC